MDDQVLDRDHLQPVLGAVGDQIGHARHRAVVVHHLADHAGRDQAGQTRQVDARLGVPGALEHAPGLGLERVDVAGLDEIAGTAVRVDRHLDRVRSVVRRDAGGDAFAGLDRDRERGLHARLVLRRHQVQPELGAALRRQREADEPAGLLGHEVDRLRASRTAPPSRGRPRSRGPRRRRRRPSGPGGCPRSPPRSSRTGFQGTGRSSADEPLEVLGQDVDLDVEPPPHGRLAERRRLARLRDQRDRQRRAVHRRDGEADAVQRDRALLDDVARELARRSPPRSPPRGAAHAPHRRRRRARARRGRRAGRSPAAPAPG